MIILRKTVYLVVETFHLKCKDKNLENRAMRIKMSELNELATQKSFSSKKILIKLGQGKQLYKLLESGKQIGYEAVKEIYNRLGESETIKIIDFGEEETLNGFKSKFIEIKGRLY